MGERNVTWPLRALAGAIFAIALVHGIRVWGHQTARASLTPRRPPQPLPAGDADGDGLSDELEAALAARFAPIVILDPRDQNRPASIPWLLSHFGGPQDGQDGFPAAIRPGSADPRDWVTYVHVYPRTDGDINIQYWFFYTYNDGPWFFDHDADWEHVTVHVDPAGVPRGAVFAQHRNSAPGVFRAWGAVRKAGDHPIVLSARGTHASYADQASLGWLEHVSDCVGIEGCADPIWRTWEAGGLFNLGERGSLLGPTSVRAAFAFAGRWGGGGQFLQSRPAPRGPSHQTGFVVDGFQ